MPGDLREPVDKRANSREVFASGPKKGLFLTIFRDFSRKNVDFWPKKTRFYISNRPQTRFLHSISLSNVGLFRLFRATSLIWRGGQIVGAFFQNRGPKRAIFGVKTPPKTPKNPLFTLFWGGMWGNSREMPRARNGGGTCVDLRKTPKNPCPPQGFGGSGGLRPGGGQKGGVRGGPGGGFWGVFPRSPHLTYGGLRGPFWGSGGSHLEGPVYK